MVSTRFYEKKSTSPKTETTSSILHKKRKLTLDYSTPITHNHPHKDTLHHTNTTLDIQTETHTTTENTTTTASKKSKPSNLAHKIKHTLQKTTRKHPTTKHKHTTTKHKNTNSKNDQIQPNLNKLQNPDLDSSRKGNLLISPDKTSSKPNTFNQNDKQNKGQKIVDKNNKFSNQQRQLKPISTHKKPTRQTLTKNPNPDKNKNNLKMMTSNQASMSVMVPQRISPARIDLLAEPNNLGYVNDMDSLCCDDVSSPECLSRGSNLRRSIREKKPIQHFMILGVY